MSKLMNRDALRGERDASRRTFLQGMATACVIGVALAGIDAAVAAAPAPRADSGTAGASGASTSEQARQQAQTVARLQQEQRDLLVRAKAQAAARPASDPVREQQLRRLAQIEQTIREENTYPRRRYISPVSVPEAYADYYKAMQRRIEERGTADFPMSDGHRLYGDLIMNLTIDAKGNLVASEVVRSSGDPFLDRKSLAIAGACAPFGAFSAAMRAKADQIVVTQHFRFQRGSGEPSPVPASGAVEVLR